MRNPARIKPFLDKLQKLWEQHPDLRFGQLVCNIANFNSDWLTNPGLFSIEDDKFEEKIKQFTVIQVPAKNNTFFGRKRF
jgi:hypothetical protein